MATPVQRLEKRALLKALYDESLPVIYLKDQTKYSLSLKEPAEEGEMLLISDQPISGVKAKNRIDMVFDYKGKNIAFTTEVLSVQDQELTCTVPDSFYKNLDRSYSRVNIPPQMKVQFTHLGDRYNLSFPKVAVQDSGDMGTIFQNSDTKNLAELTEQMSSWIKKYASGYKLVLFKDIKPSTIEERVIAETGKALYIPSTRGSFPQNDPSPHGRIITEDMFKRYLESTGISFAFTSKSCARFLKDKADNGIISDAWIPILFLEYVIGYVHVWANVEREYPFDQSMLDTLYQFVKVLAYSLKTHGYFEKGKMKNNSFDGRVIDISASGLLFLYLHSDRSAALKPESKLTVKLTTPQRTIETEAVIVRCFKDRSFDYYGCQFEKMETEDHNYLFEYIYGKPLAGLYDSTLSKQV
jgi:hypothetical protein